MYSAIYQVHFYKKAAESTSRILKHYELLSTLPVFLFLYLVLILSVDWSQWVFFYISVLCFYKIRATS